MIKDPNAHHDYKPADGSGLTFAHEICDMMQGRMGEKEGQFRNLTWLLTERLPLACLCLYDGDYDRWHDVWINRDEREEEDYEEEPVRLQLPLDVFSGALSPISKTYMVCTSKRSAALLPALMESAVVNERIVIPPAARSHMMQAIGKRHSFLLTLPRLCPEADREQVINLLDNSSVQSLLWGNSVYAPLLLCGMPSVNKAGPSNQVCGMRVGLVVAGGLLLFALARKARKPSAESAVEGSQRGAADLNKNGS